MSPAPTTRGHPSWCSKRNSSGLHSTGRSMEMHQIRHLFAVYEHLSFTQAARKCHVTQPSLTRAIQLLEKEFGGYLFHRKRSRIHLTELARIVQPYWQATTNTSQSCLHQPLKSTSRH